MTYQGHIENGKVVFDTPVPLPEGTKVEVTMLPVSQTELQPNRPEPSLKSLLKYSGIIKDLPPDAVRNLDHYLYGHPKQ